MIDDEYLATYYEKTKFSSIFSSKLLKEFFSRIPHDDLKNKIKRNEVIPQQESPIDEMFLMEACVFFRLSVFNFLAYKDLMCGNYLAWAKVTLYYSIFYAINGLLRLAGKAIIHATGISDNYNKGDRIISFQLFRCGKSHSYKMINSGRDEHKKVWDIFSNTFPDLSDTATSNFIRKERVSWNYDLFFASQTMDPPALDEAKTCCEYNFIDKNFGNYSTSESAEYHDNLRFDYGYGEILAWDFIKRGFKIIKKIGKRSKFKDEYVSFWTNLIQDIGRVSSKEETKTVISSFIESLRKEI